MEVVEMLILSAAFSLSNETKADANRPKYVLLVNMALSLRTWGFF